MPPKRKSATNDAAPPAKRGVSDRAARTGAGGWDLSEAAGSLDVDYATLGVLGRGSFAEINLVRHRKTGALRALKFCCKLDAPSFGHLRAEAALASKVRHPFVLSPLAVSDSPGRAGNFSVLLPLCPGGDLLQLLRKQPSLALGEAAVRAYGSMVVLGLRALHDAGLAYRDLKPENLLLQANGYLCLADFGFAATKAECKKKGTLVGTALYQPPELLRKLPHDASVDWWALGCLLLEMVRGEAPFAAEDDEATTAVVLAHIGRGVVPGAPRAAPAAAVAAATSSSTAAAAPPIAAATAASPAEGAAAPLSSANPHLSLFAAARLKPSATNPHLQLRLAAAKPPAAKPSPDLPAAPTAPVAPAAPAAPPTAPTAVPPPSAEMLDLCGKLLEPDGKQRLGALAAGGADVLQAHPWFGGVDWAAVGAMTLPAPHVPPPLPESTDALLLELSQRCQQGFD